MKKVQRCLLLWFCRIWNKKCTDLVKKKSCLWQVWEGRDPETLRAASGRLWEELGPHEPLCHKDAASTQCRAGLCGNDIPGLALQGVPENPVVSLSKDWEISGTGITITCWYVVMLCQFWSWKRGWTKTLCHSNWF